jgi:hypothetical protein
MSLETNFLREVMLSCSEHGDTLWRNNVGKGWVSPPKRTIVAHGPRTVRLAKGDVVLKQPYWLTWGLFKGSSDLIGIRPTIITPEMVGQLFGRFFAIEGKAPGGRVSREQTQFGKHVTDQGGLFVVARSLEDIPR